MDFSHSSASAAVDIAMNAISAVQIRNNLRNIIAP